jgi:hypothetical protein
VVPAEQGPAPDLARDDDDADEGRSSKGEALLGEEVGGGPERRQVAASA